uniref:Uncharacterized protein LOC108039467 isoform X1 n=1 Tax=Drosophila rhopaloa TaxID=1041015 RepID=A0A6P4E9V5_DRORH
MRLFVTLCTLVALSQAKPQGYNYGSGVSGSLTTSSSSGGSSGGFLAAPSHSSVASYGPLGAFQTASVGSLVGSSSTPHAVSHYGGQGATYSTGAGNGATYSTGGGHGATYTTGGGHGVTYSTGGQGATYSSGGASNYGGSSFTGFGPSPNIGFGGLAGYQAPTYQQQQEQEVQRGFQEPIIHKQFFTVAAPEEHENLERSKHLVIGRPQKNYRVVFIKAPSSSNANVKLSAEYAPKEEKTVIYVLSKKDNQLEVNDIATPAPTVPSKPEVFFIKYKTDAEASHAQQQIQGESSTGWHRRCNTNTPPLFCSRIRQDRGNLRAPGWRSGPCSVGGWHLGWWCCWCRQHWQLSLRFRRHWLHWGQLSLRFRRHWLDWWQLHHDHRRQFRRHLWRNHRRSPFRRHHHQECTECHLSATQWQIDDYSYGFIATILLYSDAIVKGFFLKA